MSTEVRRWLRPASAVLAGAVATAMLSACGSSSGSGGDSGEGAVAFFTMGLSNEYLQSATNGAKDMASKEGVKLDVFSADFDSAKQLTQIQDAVSSGKYAALVVEPIDGQSVCKSLTDAGKDMIVSVYNTPICGNLVDLYTPDTIGYFGRHQPTGGELAVKYMADALPDGGKVAYLPGPATSSIVKLFSESLLSSLEDHPELDLVSTIPGNWNAADGLKGTQDLLSAHPDIDGIWYGDDSTLSSALKWLKDTDQLGDIKIITEGGSTAIVDAVEAGEVHAATVCLPVEESTYALKAAIQTMRGEEIDVPGFDPETKIYNVFKDPQFDGGDPVLTKDNAAGFTSNWNVG